MYVVSGYALSVYLSVVCVWVHVMSPIAYNTMATFAACVAYIWYIIPFVAALAIYECWLTLFLAKSIFIPCEFVSKHKFLIRTAIVCVFVCVCVCVCNCYSVCVCLSVVCVCVWVHAMSLIAHHTMTTFAACVAYIWYVFLL